ncbi:MAG: hypothetical protein H0U13_01945 [Gemmatimonadaceae bacterium]|nr:hypothetical protein [Gemmatimonadaceae bacterium]
MSSSTSSSDVPIAGKSQRRALRALGFVVFTLAIVFLVGELLDRATVLNPNTPKIREMLALENDHNAVVYIGDSTTLDGVNPVIAEAELGMRGYNLASGGQTLVESEMVLRHYLQHNPKPRVVMLGLFVNRDPATEINPEIYVGLSGDDRATMRAKVEDQAMSPISRSFRVFNSFKIYRNRNVISYFIDHMNKRVTGESRGSELVRGHLALDYSKAEKPSKASRTAELNERGLDSFLDFCAEQRLPVLMFEPPNTPGFSGITSNRPQLIATIETRARTRRDVRFRSFDGPASLDYAKDEWSGRNHLNRKGAVRFTREQLVPYLRDELPTTR